MIIGLMDSEKIIEERTVRDLRNLEEFWKDDEG
jgi:hypothetical protein